MRPSRRPRSQAGFSGFLQLHQSARAQLRFLLVAASLLVACDPVHGPRGAYKDYIRPDARPPLVGSTLAADSLWGAAEDSDRGDGIAEERRADLEELVRRFTPTIVLPNNDFVEVDGRKYRALPTDARLLADTLQVDVIRAAPYDLVDSVNIPLWDVSADSLVSLVEIAQDYHSDPNLLAAWYFDFPGRNPGEWWETYGNLRTGPDSALWAQPTVYAHPFVENDGRVVIQYWYLFPFNDFLGNHEGDWEHLNVVLSPNGDSIAEVHYYFHARSISLPQGEYRPEVVDDSHPVAYVGGRMYNIFDYPIRLFTGDRNEGSHALFPYAGEWEAAAGLGAPESVTHPGSDSTRILPYEDFRVVLTPEPGRIDYLLKPEVLREWVWLIVPARWGFPAAPSLGSVIKLVDVGNRAPYGLPYNPGFNRTAPGLLYPGYQVQKLSFFRALIEDLIQPWYWLYIFRRPRYVHDTRGTLDREALERLGLAPRGGWSERGFGSPNLGLSLGIPTGGFADVYDNSFGFFLWRNLWLKIRVGYFELMGGYQKFPRTGTDGSLFVYPITGNVTFRAPDARFRPYASFGGGAYGWESREAVDDGGQLLFSGWDLGWNVGVGVEYYMRTRVAFDVGIRFHSTEGPGARAGIADSNLKFLTLWLGHYVRF